MHKKKKMQMHFRIAVIGLPLHYIRALIIIGIKVRRFIKGIYEEIKKGIKKWLRRQDSNLRPAG